MRGVKPCGREQKAENLSFSKARISAASTEASLRVLFDVIDNRALTDNLAGGRVRL
jgi:hypothetical protein